MICDMQAQLTALLDGELAPETAAEVQRHLEACLDCTRAYAEIMEVQEMASAWNVDAPDISARVQSALAAGDQRLLLAELQLLRREMEELRAEVSQLRRQLERRADAPSWSPPRRADYPENYPRMENDPWNFHRS